MALFVREKVTIQPIDKNLVKEEIDNISNKIIDIVNTKYNGCLRDR